MNRAQIFAFRVNDHERRAIADLAARLQRSRSDAVRFVVLEALKKLSEIETDHAFSPAVEDSKEREGAHVSD